MADLSERCVKKGVLGMLLVGVLDADELVADGEVSHQMKIYCNMFREVLTFPAATTSFLDKTDKDGYHDLPMPKFGSLIHL